MPAKKKTNSKQSNQKSIVKVSHLTVTTHPDGKVDLEWDFDQLDKDIKQAIENFQKSQKKVKSKVARKKNI